MGYLLAQMMRWEAAHRLWWGTCSGVGGAGNDDLAGAAEADAADYELANPREFPRPHLPQSAVYLWD